MGRRMEVVTRMAVCQKEHLRLTTRNGTVMAAVPCHYRGIN